MALLGGAVAVWPLAARAAAGEAADDRLLGVGHAFSLDPLGRRFLSGSANSAGSRTALSRSNIAGRRDAMSATLRSRPNSSD